MWRVLSDLDTEAWTVSYTDVASSPLFASFYLQIILCIILQVKLNCLLQGLEEELFPQQRTLAEDAVLSCACCVFVFCSTTALSWTRGASPCVGCGRTRSTRPGCAVGQPSTSGGGVSGASPWPPEQRKEVCTTHWEAELERYSLLTTSLCCLLLLFHCAAKAEACCMHKRNMLSKLQENDFLNNCKPTC